MSVKESLERVGNHRVTRRGLFGLSAVGGGVLVSGFTPEKAPILTEKDKIIFPGWIESGIKSPLIKTNKGHFSWLKEAVFTNPILLELTSDYYKYLNQNLRRKNRLELGEALSYAVGSAQKTLGAVDSEKVNQKTSLDLESVHAGVIVFAAGFMRWFESVDLEKLGVPMGEFKTAYEYYLDLNGVVANVYPQLFAKKEELAKGVMAGQDRAIHFAQHLFIVFEFLYSKHFDLNDHKSMPNFLNFIASLGGKPEDQARLFSQSVGLLYELSALFFKGENWPILNQDERGIVDGPFDPSVDADYKGNNFGAETGITLFNYALARKSLGAIFDELNDRKYFNFNAEPSLSSIR